MEKTITKYLPTPDWEGLKKVADANGYNLVVHYTNYSTYTPRADLPSFQFSNFEAAADGSELVAVGGHAGANAAGDRVYIPLAEGLSGGVAPNSNTVLDFVSQNTGAMKLNAKVLAVFGCDSDKLPISDMFKPSNPNAMFVGVKDTNGDGLSSVPTNNWATYRFVEEYIKSGGNVKSAERAAQLEYKHSNAGHYDEGGGGKKHWVYTDKFDIVTSRRIE